MPLLAPSSAGSRDRALSSNRFRIAAYLDPQVGLQGTWERDILAMGKHIKKKNFGALKSYDYHVLMQQILPQAL